MSDRIDLDHDVALPAQRLHPGGEDDRGDFPHRRLHALPPDDGVHVGAHEQADAGKDRHRHEDLDGGQSLL